MTIRKKSITRLVLFLTICVSGSALLGIPFFRNGLVPADAIKIMTFNVGTTRNHPGKQPTETIAAIIKEESPDIVMLQEASPPKATKLAELLDYRIFTLPEKTQHVQILSRFPVQLKVSNKLCDYNRTDNNLICAEITTDQGQVLVCSVYLASIRTNEMGTKLIVNDKRELAVLALKEVVKNTSRSRGTQDLVDLLTPMEYKNVVIAGDFNSLFLSKAVRIMRKKFRDSSWFTPSLFSSSHKTHGLFHLPVKVDYIFHSKNLSSSGTKIILESPGDHYPVVTNVHLN